MRAGGSLFVLLAAICVWGADLLCDPPSLMHQQLVLINLPLACIRSSCVASGITIQETLHKCREKRPDSLLGAGTVLGSCFAVCHSSLGDVRGRARMLASTC